jgi:hypothetical protein
VVGIVLMSEEEINGIKPAPTWPAQVTAAHTAPRELNAFGQATVVPMWIA